MTLASRSHLNNGDGSNSAARILTDYYRCPANLLPAIPSSPSTGKQGYFKLGQDTVFGGLARGQTSDRPEDAFHDALAEVSIDAERVQLPFDAAELVDNLRQEQYCPRVAEEGGTQNGVIRKTYYFLRPWLSVSLRRHAQKLHLRGWDKIPFPKWPVDFTVERIHQKLMLLAMRARNIDKMPFVWFWPEGYKSCAILTHDVEETSGRDFCSQLMDIDESFGFRSSFQVVPENRYSVPKSFLDSIVNRGFEVNVHDLKHDGRLFIVHEEFLRRAKEINRYAKQFRARGFRSGVLYRNADWFDSLEFLYDMSIPNVAHLDPQRGGCCTVMPYFIQNLVELPVTCTQDYTLFYILGAQSIDLWKQQIGLLTANNGLISVIIHPDYVIEPKVQKLYRALLGYLAELRTSGEIWSPLPVEVAEWWRQRSLMKVVSDGSGWRIEGPGMERAKLAFASRAGDTLTYSFS